VINKADLTEVRRWLGNLPPGAATQSQCHKAIAAWGGEHALRVLTQRFRSVGYFNCAAKAAPDASGRPRYGEVSGVLRPLEWLLRTETQD
jgi:hypothetical protein